MTEEDQINLDVSISNIEYRLEIIEAKLGITGVYMDMEKAQSVLKSDKTSDSPFLD